MRQKRLPLPHAPLAFVLVLILMHCIADAGVAMDLRAHHDLTVILFPEKSELEGRDRIEIRLPLSIPVELLLSSHARIRAVRLDGNDLPYTFNRGRLTLAPDRKKSSPPVELSIDYTCRFDDPAPVRPLNSDNPGFGVSGTISTRGTFILSGAGWYPQVAHSKESFDLRVVAPADTVAVTAGRLVGITHQEGGTVSRWQIDNPPEGLSLSAGPYAVEHQTRNGMTASTFLFPGNRRLSPRYLEASLRYLERYSDLFGAYPFAGFAVVENFFPTGYGFPSYTLLGGRVLSLPFIPETSLPHEIVHNWWGNGVLVDFNSGNWCEGLTSYTADYLNKELKSPDDARDYRRQALRNYASLVSESTDFPLSRFRSRTDPASKAVGYDKTAMVFHMLRQTMGDDAFWNALRDLYRHFLFKHASWQDLQKIFEHHANESLEGFFHQWITRPGAPSLRLENVRQVSDIDGYRTSGRLVQKKPYYDIALALVLETEDGRIGKTLHFAGRQTEFDIRSANRPRMLTADPAYHLFRQLAPEEMPPTVNTLKGSQSIVMVVTDRLGSSIAMRLARAMGIEPIRTVYEAALSQADIAGADLLFIGLPESAEQLEMLPGELELAPDSFLLAGQRFDGPADVLFFVGRHSELPGRVVSLLHPLSAEAADQAIMKIPHYGRYSYLAFSAGRNRSKGTWEVKASPMRVRLQAAQSP